MIVQDGEIIAEGANRVVAENDPTWHGEIEAIRKACKAQGSFKLRDAALYTSAEPCPMCMRDPDPRFLETILTDRAASAADLDLSRGV